MSEDQTRRRPGRPPAGGPTPTRSLRLGDVYDQAQARAREREETLTHVVEQKLADYVANDPARELYDASMAKFLMEHAKREAWEFENGVLATASTLPREILAPWRHALAQVRLLRAEYRMRGFEPPEPPERMPWIDERRVEMKTEGDNVFWIQTEAPKASRFA
ncbi:hypothetical protein [Actinoplanes subtropicus]|uniref:hypothetical protein n=1 Tax=Actinoplanes subtropicus TaxID=543632 RepID=UPI0012F877A4|nr:hypothetical protein [Actinoplanes subtropicus]